MPIVYQAWLYKFLNAKGWLSHFVTEHNQVNIQRAGRTSSEFFMGFFSNVEHLSVDMLQLVLVQATFDSGLHPKITIINLRAVNISLKRAGRAFGIWVDVASHCCSLKLPNFFQASEKKKTTTTTPNQSNKSYCFKQSLQAGYSGSQSRVASFAGSCRNPAGKKSYLFFTF